MVKTSAKLLRQMVQRGWTETQIEEAQASGERRPARNLDTRGSATRYIHQATGRSVVVDDASEEVIHVGGDGFIY